MIERVLGIFLPVLLVVAVGYFFARRVKPDMAMVNRISMTILAPALIFSALASKDFDVGAYGMLMVGSIGVVLGSGLLAWPFARLLHADARTFVPPMMFNNCGNMGLPLAVLAYGASGFSAMVALFTISNLIHFTLGQWIVDHHARFGSLLRNPMVWSTFLGFLFALTHPPMPEWASVAIRMVGDALVPMMLLSLGVRLYEVRWDDWHIGVIGGLVCPLTGIAMAALLAPVLGLDREQTGLLLIFGSLPPAVLNFMVAEQFRQEPAKVASIVLIGNVLSIVFVPLGLVLALH
ncbi:MAG: AEC family transporter [Betaproteobacteria bacterium]|nr:AEC family transporter [Betaproteobacteria bacterium]MCC7217108.1 AEC family transporter [Burkholderiales bacterium]